MSVPGSVPGERTDATSGPPRAPGRTDGRTDGAVVLLRLAGPLDPAAGEELVASGLDVVLDLRDVDVISTTAGSRALTELAERLADAGRRLLVVAGANRRTIEQSPAGGPQLFATVDAAMGSLRAGSRTGPAVDHGRTPSLAGALSKVARSLEAEPGIDATLHAIVSAAMTHIAGAEQAGITLVEHGRPRTVVPTADVVRDLDEQQYRLKEGPCVDVITDHRTYRSGDLSMDKRWPAFGPAAVAHGVRSMLCYRLFVSDNTMGTLNLYSSQPDAFSDHTEQDGQLFATHAAIALIGAQKETQLTAAIENRDTIATAKGILMERHGVDAATAFRMLAETSQDSNVKLYKVAEWLVDHRGQT